jgi:uncharacterized protein (DUF2062 family)
MAKDVLQRRLRPLYLGVRELRGSPHELALGMAIGILIGIMPIVPFHMIAAVTLAILLKASKITAVGATWICNPVTVYPIYNYCYKIGTTILGFNYNVKLLTPMVGAINAEQYFKAATSILGGGAMAIGSFLLGGIILGVLFSVPSYFISFYLFKAITTWRKSGKPIKA